MNVHPTENSTQTFIYFSIYNTKLQHGSINNRAALERIN